MREILFNKLRDKTNKFFMLTFLLLFRKQYFDCISQIFLICFDNKIHNNIFFIYEICKEEKKNCLFYHTNQQLINNFSFSTQA